ncbi:GNAT family N-acetyltransferase [Thalassotalea sp. 1_MG-2023]|uniref:GNAT family N-acetyltransferase n=1 Tax=Thalassotalea sp. 1_MG-2023 TaxID=3062680 RepID=UPI0026E38409|nr:GNAT family N-acetyltransferase [Thalassotalea sp. 1_MG-2023]MDO6428799.1 GNAT family N-acetyltransferase [Thalassotalea sp. 1_MG-2023]
MNTIDSANLTNLKQLWRLYGATTLYRDDMLTLNAVRHWPHRHWIDSSVPAITDDLFENNHHKKLSSLIQKASKGAIFALWQTAGKANIHQMTKSYLLSNGWQKSFNQTAMYLPLNHQRLLPEHPTLTLTPVTSYKQVKQWCHIGSAAFNYRIDIDAVLPLLSNNQVMMYLASSDAVNIGASMLLHSDTCTGVHQVGVLPIHQGKGYAKAIMMALINQCNTLNIKYLVLQASQAGLPLYKKLGFIEQFTIENFQLFGIDNALTSTDDS